MISHQLTETQLLAPEQEVEILEPVEAMNQPEFYGRILCLDSDSDSPQADLVSVSEFWHFPLPKHHRMLCA